MLPPAPGRFSMRIGWPRAPVSLGWRTRASVSCTPPGANEMTSLIGLSGQACPCAGAGAEAAAARTAAQANTSFMSFLLDPSWWTPPHERTDSESQDPGQGCARNLVQIVRMSMREFAMKRFLPGLLALPLSAFALN